MTEEPQKLFVKGPTTIEKIKEMIDFPASFTITDSSGKNVGIEDFKELSNDGTFIIEITDNRVVLKKVEPKIEEKNIEVIRPKLEPSNIKVVERTNFTIINVENPTTMGEIIKFRPASSFVMVDSNGNDVMPCKDDTIIPLGIYTLYEYLKKDIINHDDRYISQLKTQMDFYRTHGCGIVELGEDGIFRCNGSIRDCNHQPINIWCPMKLKLRDVLK